MDTTDRTQMDESETRNENALKSPRRTATANKSAWGTQRLVNIIVCATYVHIICMCLYRYSILYIVDVV